jgi:Ca2+/Na+ antiporter
LGLLVALVLWFLFSSCSSWRMREKQSFRERVERHQLEVDSLEMKWNVERQRVQFSHSDQQVVIWPIGEFRFDLDSGYRGEALVVEISRKGVDSVVEQEESLGQLAEHTQVQEYEQEGLEEEFEYLNEKREVETEINWLVIIVGLMCVLIGIRWIIIFYNSCYIGIKS